MGPRRILLRFGRDAADLGCRPRELCDKLPSRVIEGDPGAAVDELVRALREEAKVV